MATRQLVYQLLLQVRTIRLILAWVLIFSPAIAYRSPYDF
jgi:hypothetical protein